MVNRWILVMFIIISFSLFFMILMCLFTSLQRILSSLAVTGHSAMLGIYLQRYQVNLRIDLRLFVMIFFSFFKWLYNGSFYDTSYVSVIEFVFGFQLLSTHFSMKCLHWQYNLWPLIKSAIIPCPYPVSRILQHMQHHLTSRSQNSLILRLCLYLFLCLPFLYLNLNTSSGTSNKQ